MSEYDDELLQEVDDDIVTSRAPSRRKAGWGNSSSAQNKSSAENSQNEVTNDQAMSGSELPDMVPPAQEPVVPNTTASPPLEDQDLLGDGTDDDIVTRRSSPVGMKKTVRFWPGVALALVVGIVLGVWMVSTQPTTTADMNPTPTASATPTEDPMIRKAELQVLLGDDPNNVDAHLELGVLLFNDDDLADAKTHWDTVVQLDPTNVEGWYNLGFYYLYSDPPDYAKTQEMWDQVIKLEPDGDMANMIQGHLSDALNPSNSSATPTDSPSPTSTETGQ
ncbi:MAG: hypothetical protein FWF43_04055 [Propionibacteriaceae bacterium]|nr:hypothetical protein [Propionibacteriaceae bacterium]